MCANTGPLSEFSLNSGTGPMCPSQRQWGAHGACPRVEFGPKEQKLPLPLISAGLPAGSLYQHVNQRCLPGFRPFDNAKVHRLLQFIITKNGLSENLSDNYPVLSDNLSDSPLYALLNALKNILTTFFLRKISEGSSVSVNSQLG